VTREGAGREGDSGRVGSGSIDCPPIGAVAGEASLFAAGERLFGAARRLVAAVARLAAAEARLAKSRLAVAFLAGVALIAFAVSLWASAVALIGWAFRVATGSTGIALGLLVVLHLILIAGSWLAIKRGVRNASFPDTRAELAALGRGVWRSAARSPASAAASMDEKEPAP
jgi:uncharacterized membrane protein YqjE